MQRFKLTKKVKITRIENGKKYEIIDIVAREIELNIFVNKIIFAKLYCSPINYKFLGVGFLLTNGIIREREKIKSLVEDKENLEIEIKEFNNPGVGVDFPYFISEKMNSDKPDDERKGIQRKKNKIEIKNIFSLLIEMQKKAYFFDITGGVHSCGLANKKGDILLFCEDISRYNTVDRIFGEAFLKDINISDKIIVTSCRITSGILKKIINGGASFVISRSAVSEKAIVLAKQKNITLVGFARGERINIYNNCSDI